MHVAVIGGSLAGLAAANIFHRLGASVTVFEKFPAHFEKRGSSLGFCDVSLWEYIRGAQMIRLGHQASRAQGAFFYGDLWTFLYEGLPDGCVQFNHPVTDIGNDIMNPIIDGKTYDLAVIADGGWSAFRHLVNGDKQPEYSGYIIWRAKVNAVHIPNFQGVGAYNIGKYHAIALPVPVSDGENFVMGGLAIGAPESDELVKPPREGANRHAEAAQDYTLPSWFLPFVSRNFGHCANGEVLRWFTACSLKGKITPQPLYEFMAEKVVAGRLVVIGDAAHMASPATAAGAHTGMLDVAGLFQSFSLNAGLSNIDAALRMYAPEGEKRAKQLYLRSKEVSRQFAYTADAGL